MELYYAWFLLIYQTLHFFPHFTKFCRNLYLNVLNILSHKHSIQSNLLYFSTKLVSLSVNSNYKYIESVYSLHLVPAPIVTLDPEVAVIIYNSTFNLTCTVTSLTVPSITWSSSGVAGFPSEPSITNHIATHTSILTLEQVKLNYTGTYTCTAVNEGGLDTATADIIIVGKDI